MAQPMDRLERHRKARETLAGLFAEANSVIVIHYSCESFYDRPEGNSPRITSIAVRILGLAQATSFSIHQMAERQCFSPTQLEQHYNELEFQMLAEFFAYVDKHPNFKWLHWNMRDINYGFQAMYHRYRVLQGHPQEIPESHLVDLARLLHDIYGREYITDPHMTKLVEKNEMRPLGFLSGPEEAQAFTKKEYVRLHQSTLRKVYVIADIAQLANEGSLKTNATWRGMYGLTIRSISEYLAQSWPIIVLAIVASILQVIPWLISMISLFIRSNP